MMINDQNREELKKMLRGRALYIALGVCVLAAGIISYTSVSSNFKKQVSISTTEPISTHININDRVLPDETTLDPEPVEETTEAPQSEAPSVTEPSSQAVFDNFADPLESETKTEEISFSLPLSTSMSKDYSMGIPVFSETMKDYRTHNGIDFVAEKGMGVKSIAEGKVIEVSADPLWGNSVYIDHGQGIVSKISGLADEGIIANGAEVYSDTVIGVVGEIPVENADGSHIHFEIRVDNKIADPMEVMGFVSDED
ncbi:MAG: M23 family metallopeptidase [Oscillospiraceae bacterium]|nr:M23 family metallopeptidase [Oscillospiraceae bacterium]